MSENLDKNKLVVDRIQNGTVIDHIPAGTAFLLVDILKLSKDDKVMVGTNLSSEKMGSKDIIKIENREFTTEQMNSIALITRGATFSVIRNHKRVSKTQVELPKKIDNIIRCPNDMCITIQEDMNSNFELETVEGKDKVRCSYCEKVFDMDYISKYINI